MLFRPRCEGAQRLVISRWPAFLIVRSTQQVPLYSQSPTVGAGMHQAAFNEYLLSWDADRSIVTFLLRRLQCTSFGQRGLLADCRLQRITAQFRRARFATDASPLCFDVVLLRNLIPSSPSVREDVVAVSGAESGVLV